MTKVRRDISSVPLRTAEETWEAIIDLITDDDSVDTDQLRNASPIVSSLIADEIFSEHPITVAGAGPRLVLYTVHYFDAVEAGTGIDALSWNPTAGNWNMALPCDDANLDWVRKALSEKAPRIKVHELGQEPDLATAEATEKSDDEELEINWGILGGA